MSKEQTGYSSPLRFIRNLRPGVEHPLGGIPIEVIGQMRGVLSNTVSYFFDHFTGPAGPLAEGDAGAYTLVGTTGTAVAVIEQEDHGVLRVETGTTENDNAVWRQRAQVINYATDKLILWACRISLSDADDMEFFAGLTVSNGDFVAGLPASGLFFSKAETATQLSFQIRESGTSTTVGPLGPTLTDGGDVIIVIRVENGHVTPYIQDVATSAWTVGATTLSSDANMPLVTDDLLSHHAIETGAAAAKNAQLDWLYMSKEA